MKKKQIKYKLKPELKSGVHYWTCLCKICQEEFFSSQARFICYGCEKTQKRDKILNQLIS